MITVYQQQQQQQQKQQNKYNYVMRNQKQMKQYENEIKSQTTSTTLRKYQYISTNFKNYTVNTYVIGK